MSSIDKDTLLTRASFALPVLAFPLASMGINWLSFICFLAGIVLAIYVIVTHRAPRKERWVPFAGLTVAALQLIISIVAGFTS